MCVCVCPVRTMTIRNFLVSPVFIDRVCFVYEVIAISESWLMLGNRDFSRGEMNEIMSFVVT